ARGLASGPPSSADSTFRRPSSSNRIPAPPSFPALTPFPPPSSTPRDELALTRPAAEVAPLRALEHPPLAADSPPLDLARIASAFATSPASQDIAARSGAFLAPQPASIEALESFCAATRGEAGVAPDKAVWLPSDEDEEVILSWGALLGETI